MPTTTFVAGCKATIAPAQEAVRRQREAQALAGVPTAAEPAARTDELRLGWCRALGRKGAAKSRALAAASAAS